MAERGNNVRVTCIEETDNMMEGSDQEESASLEATSANGKIHLYFFVHRPSAFFTVSALCAFGYVRKI